MTIIIPEDKKKELRESLENWKAYKLFIAVMASSSGDSECARVPVDDFEEQHPTFEISSDGGGDISVQI